MLFYLFYLFYLFILFSLFYIFFLVYYISCGLILLFPRVSDNWVGSSPHNIAQRQQSFKCCACLHASSYLPGIGPGLGPLNPWSLRRSAYRGARPCTLTLWTGTTAPSGVGRMHHFWQRGLCACRRPTHKQIREKQTTQEPPSFHRSPLCLGRMTLIHKWRRVERKRMNDEGCSLQVNPRKKPQKDVPPRTSISARWEERKKERERYDVV